ncbi:MAG: zinc-dependent metalloprotease family protein [Flavobacteriales bacterium]|nr:zinc-dependent metalloprotease family protein [Flavobacteriales bacterium]
MKKYICTAFAIVFTVLFYSQKVVDPLVCWKELSGLNSSSKSTQYIKSRKFKKLSFDEALLFEALEDVSHRDEPFAGEVVVISLLNPDGRVTRFAVTKNTTMHPVLCEKFPSIRTFDLKGIDDLNQIGKMDITPLGFHAMVMSDKSTFFIDPMFHGETEVYMSYYRDDFFTDKVMDCSFHSTDKKNESIGSLKTFGSCELRTYRCAISATGEYTDFQGGTLSLAQAAQVTTMNRVNGVFERDIAVTMEIIANNDLIIYTNSNTDPFTNGSPGNMISENQSNTNSVIGSGNYDIGHVFGTNSGGLAGLGVVCSNNNKARGVTGSSAPVGDPFDIDYVAHEMGHQFKGNHSFNNSCSGNRNNNTAMEPGSGSTIMAYAGICSPNVQSNSDDHFHGVNLEEIGGFIVGNANSCASITPLVNVSPVISSTNGNVSVPVGTPFVLTANATDADGDPITYCWEQMDNEISTQSPSPTSVDGPNFRSNSPSTNPSRFFPSLATVISGVNDDWEVLPTVSRTMNFRVFVRDNSITGGCNDHADVTLSVDANSGPFVLNYPSASGISWTASSTETILWDVANTDNSPVNCSMVDIILSTDGGFTYPIIVATGVANDGSENITVPNNITTTARIRIMSENGTFYDISNNDFEITAANNMVANFTANNTEICEGGSIDFTDVSAGNPVSWSWVFNGGNPAISSDQNPVGIQYASSGIYDVELTVSNGAGSNTITETSYINVAANPTVIAGASTLNAVTGESIDFNNLGSNGTSYTWDFGDGANSTLSSPSHVYNTTGSFTVILTGNLGNCSDSDTIIINVGVNDVLYPELDFEFTIYPNPVNDNLTIEFIKPSVYKELKIMDNIGKVIFQKEISSSMIENIDMSKFSSGLYSFMLSGDQKTRVTKVFKK